MDTFLDIPAIAISKSWAILIYVAVVTLVAILAGELWTGA